MSCYQVDDEHIHVLIHAALTYARTGTVGRFYLPTDQPEGAPGVIPWLDGTTRLVLTEATADRVGQTLRDANTACINGKYAEDEAYVYAYRRPRFTTWTPLEILHAINGYRYQSDESPDWPTSPAAAFCQMLEASMIRSLPGYDAGPWTIDASSIPAAIVR